MADLTFNVRELSLASIGGGLAEDQLRAEVERFVASIAAHHESLDEGQGPVFAEKGGSLVFTFKAEVELVYDVQSCAMKAAVKTSANHPARRGTAHPVLLRNGQVYLEAEAEQLGLVTPSRHPNRS